MVGYLPDGTGAVTTTVQDKLRESVSVKDFGADPAASAAVNTAAIQAAANYCETTGARLIGSAGTYSVNGTITLKCSGDLSMMRLSAAGASMTGPVVRVGRTDGAFYTARLDLRLPEVVNTSPIGTGWATAGLYPGVEIANVYHSVIQINYINGFVVGLDIGGYEFGNGLNTFTFLGYVHNNKVNVRLMPKGIGGWVTDNIFVGLNARIDSGNSGVPGTRNIQLLPYSVSDNTTSWPNNNLFLKPCIEGNAPEYHIEVAGSDNVFQSPRTETTSPTTQKILFTGHPTLTKTIRNIIRDGYSPTAYVFTESGACGSNGFDSVSASAKSTISSKPIYSTKSYFSKDSAHYRGYPSTANILNASDSDTNWVWQLSEANADFKSSESANPIIRISYGGFLYLDSGSTAPAKYLTGTSSGIRTGTDFYPASDGTLTLGAGTLRWSIVYSSTGTISTSDQREKQDIAGLDEAERRVALAIKGLVKKFRFKDAVAQKGDDARIHVGVIAQEVIAAFQAEGLDATRYGIVCYDEWEAEPEKLDEEGNVITPAREAGNRYGVRYEELFAFILGATVNA